MSPPVKTADEVRAACLGPVPKMGTGEEWMDGVKEEQQWENVALHPGTDQSGLFNLDMELTSGTSIVEHGIDSPQLTMDPSATSAVDLAELFPDLTDFLADPTPGAEPEGEEDGPSPLATKEEGVTGGEEVFTNYNIFVDPAPNITPEEAKSVVVIDAGHRKQLPSTSSYASGSETSDYEDGLTPAEVDSALEHFFNEFIDLGSLVNNPAGDAGPTTTVDVAAVRSLIDDTTNENGSSLSDLLNITNDSLACSTVNAAKRVKSEENDDDEEEEEEMACTAAKRSRTTTKNSAANPKDTYRSRRIKNNVACKRARQNRKKRDSDLVTTAQVLEAENALLRAKIEELTEIAALSRKALIEAIGK